MPETSNDPFNYPTPQPFAEGTLAVSDGHRLHYYRFGNPDGVPVLFSHGGPGESVKPEELRIFDPAVFHIVTMDQRGCGRSTPHMADDLAGALAGNNPAQLAEDCEALRRELSIDSWHLRGNSWGATLSLLYAIAYPQHVRSLLLSGVYLNRASDLGWYRDRLGLFFPQQAAAIKEMLPEALQPPQARIDLIASGFEAGAMTDQLRTVCIAHALWDEAATRFTPQEPEWPEASDKQRSNYALGGLAAYTLMRHPLPEDWFATDAAKAALAQIGRIRLLAGQYDVTTPPGTAAAVAAAHPQAELTIVPDGGHVTSEPAMAQVLTDAAEALKAS